MRSSIARRAARVVSDFVSHAPSARGGAAAPSKGIKVINITPYAASEVTGGGGLPHARAGVSAQTKPSQLDKHWVDAFHKIHGRGFASSAAARAGLSPAETKKRMDEINDNFAEAREEIEIAEEIDIGEEMFEATPLVWLSQPAFSQSVSQYLLARLCAHAPPTVPAGAGC